MSTVKSFTGAASATTLDGGISAVATSLTVASGSSFPTANFNIVIDRGLSGEEKILVTSRSGNTFTLGTRGYDATTAASHASGAAVEHCITAVDQQENNDHINATTGHGATGAVVGTTNTQTLTNKTLTTPTIGDFTNATHTHLAASSGGSLVLPFRGVKVYRSSTQNISTSTETLLTWNSEFFDTNTFHDTGSNTSRLTVPAGLGGYYLVHCTVSLASAASGITTLDLYKNADYLTFFGHDERPFSSAGNTYLAVDAVLALGVGDFVEARVFQSSGVTKTAGAGGAGSQVDHFGMTFLGS